MRKSEIELMIEELQALLQYENVFKDKQDSKSMASVDRLRKRVEEWEKISSEYGKIKEEILERIQELRKILMKQIEVFEGYYKKYGAEA
jgi:hypothetical protein